MSKSLIIFNGVGLIIIWHFHIINLGRFKKVGIINVGNNNHFNV